MRSVCVFCGASSGHDPAYALAARRFGEVLARHGIELVWGAGNVGLMGVVADAVLSHGGRAVGVIPDFMVERELAHTAASEILIVDSMHARKAAMADRILAAVGPEPKGKRVGVLGVTFKPETDDMRDAPSLVILPKLVAGGVQVVAFDPQPSHARQALPAAVGFAGTALDAAKGADAVVVLTEWNEFRALPPDRLKAAMKGDVVLDLRNVWDPAAMRAAGFTYSSIGRP